jgi:hypothetical protein
MQFASLTSLWFAVTLPVIIIMYLFKRKYIDTEIPSYLLWNRVLKDIEANRPWQKLRNNLLLLIQLLVAAILVLALMQPFVWSDAVQKSHIVIILDRSASMSAFMADIPSGEDSKTRLLRAKQQMLEFIEKLERDQQVTLIAMGEKADILLTRESDQDILKQALVNIETYYGRTVYKETMSLAASLARDDANGEIHLYSDGQWADTFQGLNIGATVQIKKIAEQEIDNIQLIQFGVKRNTAQGTVSAVATIKNEGSRTRTADLAVHNENELHSVYKEELQPGEQKTLFMDQLPLAAYYKLSVEAEDLLKADNISYAFLAGAQPRQALLLSDGNLFLEKALRINGVEVLKAQLNAQGTMVMPDSEFDFIIVDAIDTAILETEQWQDMLQQKPVWYINDQKGKIGNIVPAAVEYSISEHPITQYIHFEDTHIAALSLYETIPWGEPVISVGNTPLIYAGSVHGHPQVLFTFDLHQSDLPLRSEFPVFVQNIVNWLSSGAAVNLGSAVAGEKLEIALSGDAAEAEWIPVSAETAAKPADIDGEFITNMQTVPAVPGLYQFVEKDKEGEIVQSRYLHVKMDPRESSLAYQPPLNFTEADMDLTDSRQAVEPSAENSDDLSRYSLVSWLILCLILLLFVEWGVYQRGSSL